MTPPKNERSHLQIEKIEGGVLVDQSFAGDSSMPSVPLNEGCDECWKKGQRAGVMRVFDALAPIAAELDYRLVAYLMDPQAREAS